MKHEIRSIDHKGSVLWLTHAGTELGIALDYGIRIVHLSCEGMENLFYSQPEDLSDGLTTPDGWRIYGGHRYWTAPESEKSYYPDNDPIEYTLLENGVTLLQKPDPWIGVQKKLTVTFREDGAVLLEHEIKNTTDTPITFASWGVNTFHGADSHAEVLFDGGTAGSYVPQRRVSLWGSSALTDPRVRFEQEKICVKHIPSDTSYKIGIFSAGACAKFYNRGQEFTLTFAADRNGTYPDNGCNFELYLDKNVMELEALGQLKTMNPGQTNGHWECWQVRKTGETI